MATVKGSKQYKMQVVAYRPVIRAIRNITFLLVVAAGIAGAFFYGNFKGTEIQKEAIEERDSLRLLLSDTVKEAESYRQQVANLNLGAQVDRKANEGVRQEVIELKNQIAELQADISFYRGLMSPAADKRGLTIGSLDVIETAVPRTYEYKLVIQQLANNHQVLSGYLNFVVVGRSAGEETRIHLKDLSSRVSAENIKLRFRYFQNFEGTIILPEGFEPSRIELMAKSAGSKPAQVSKKFGWLVQEN